MKKMNWFLSIVMLAGIFLAACTTAEWAAPRVGSVPQAGEAVNPFPLAVDLGGAIPLVMPDGSTIEYFKVDEGEFSFDDVEISWIETHKKNPINGNCDFNFRLRLGDYSTGETSSNPGPCQPQFFDEVKIRLLENLKKMMSPEEWSRWVNDPRLQEIEDLWMKYLFGNLG